jgi:putative nucleotidyltransferase with HDIG domain
MSRRKATHMDERQFLERVDRIRDLPTLPSIVLKLNELLQDPETSVKRISRVIEKDQAIALKILKLVNSAFYGFKSKISDLHTAIIMLGFNAIRNAIVSVSVFESFGGKLRLDGFDLSDFWKHSLAVAVTSKNLSYSTRTNSPDNCFVGGLLHDVGKIVLARFFQEEFAAIWSTCRSEKLSFDLAEQRVMPISHAAIGAHLAGRWQLPSGLVDAIRLHHVYDPTNANAEVALIVHLADLIVNGYLADRDCVIDMGALHPDARRFLLGALRNVGDFYASIAEEIESAYAFFLAEPGGRRLGVSERAAELTPARA